jgi:hypothetical protein
MIVRVRIRRLTIDQQLRTEPSTVRAAIGRELGGLFIEHLPPARLVKDRVSTAVTNSINPRARQ